MGPIETRVLEILLAMSRGKALGELGFINEAHVYYMTSHQLIDVKEGSLTEKGQCLVRLLKDGAAYWINHGKTPRPN